jgi:CRP-like cAMP-binding protein
MDKKLALIHLESISLFKDIPVSILEKLAAGGAIKYRPSRSSVYQAGDPAEHVFILSEGLVKVGNFYIDGKEVLKSIVMPGELFGELGLTGENLRSEFAIPFRGACTYYAIRVTDLKQAMTENSELMFRIMTGLGARVGSAEKRFESYVFQDSRSRVIDFILSYAKKVGAPSASGVIFSHFMTHQDIANLTGASRQFVTAVLNDLRRSGYIGFNRITITVKNAAGLEAELSSGMADHV